MRLIPRRFIALLAAPALLAASAAQALDPATPLSDYHHTIWTSKDGAPAEITSMAQTPDGWLWLGTPTGIYRFDGVRFEPYVPPPGSKLEHSRISELLATPDGDLWIGYVDLGFSVRRSDGRLEHLAAPADKVRAVFTLTRDVDNSMWLASSMGTRRLAQGKWQTIGPEMGVESATQTVLTDQHGRLYLGSDQGVSVLNRATGKFERIASDNALSLIESPDGQLWSGETDQLRKLPTPPPTLPRPAWFNQSEGHSAGIFDRDGNLWALRCPRGLCVVRGARKLGASIKPSRDATDKFDQPWQVSSLSTNLVLEDHLGNIWLSTQAGLERFRNSAVLPSAAGGADGYYILARGADGETWASDRRSGAAWMLRPGQPAQLQASYRYAAAAMNGDLLLARADYLERRHGAQVQKIAWPVVPRTERVYSLFDDGRHLWLKMGGQSMVLVDGEWRKISAYGMRFNYHHFAAQGDGKAWFTTSEGVVSQFDNGKVLASWSAQQTGVGAISGVFAGEQAIVAGEEGMAALHAGGWRKLLVNNPLVLRNVSGMTQDANGDRWLNGARGVLHVRRADWQRSMEDPDVPLRYDLFDESDGYAGEAASGVRHNTAVTDSKGQLWFSSTAGLWRIDPQKLWRRQETPQVELRALKTTRAWPLQAGLRLPPGTSQLRLDYTGLGVGKPEKLRFRYRLDGVDQEWQDAGTRRSAYYTNLGPGDYRFRVSAVTDDGIWSKEESLAFEVAPTIVQSTWFKAAIALLSATLLYQLYRYRLRINTQRVLERFNLRVAERESIARDLHDTLLQSMQGVIYSVKAIAMDLPAQEPMRRAMERTVRMANDALTEGRDRVSELRTDDALRAPLAEALRAIGAEYHGADLRIEVRSDGVPHTLHPLVHDELLLMGRECLLNAIRHAQASEVRVLLQWSERALKLVVSDNGVGLPPAVAATRSKPGHWGMEGLKERAQRLQANLELETGAGGTAWSITVPATLAYRRRDSDAAA